MADTMNAGLSAIVENAREVITNPAGFYRNMPKQGGFADPVVFVAAVAAATGLLLTFLSLFGGGQLGAMAVGVGAIVIVPIMAVIGSFVGAAMLFVVWRLMGSTQSYETAYRCSAYAAAIYPITALLSVIPYIGSIVGVVWGMYLMATASVEVHELEQSRVYMVFGIMGAILVLMNVSGEMAARRLEPRLQELERATEQMQDMSPQEAGKALGEFLQGLQEGTEGAKETEQ